MKKEIANFIIVLLMGVVVVSLNVVIFINWRSSFSKGEYNEILTAMYNTSDNTDTVTTSNNMDTTTTPDTSTTTTTDTTTMLDTTTTTIHDTTATSDTSTTTTTTDTTTTSDTSTTTTTDTTTTPDTSTTTTDTTATSDTSTTTTTNTTTKPDKSTTTTTTDTTTTPDTSTTTTTTDTTTKLDKSTIKTIDWSGAIDKQKKEKDKTSKKYDISVFAPCRIANPTKTDLEKIGLFINKDYNKISHIQTAPDKDIMVILYDEKIMNIVNCNDYSVVEYKVNYPVDILKVKNDRKIELYFSKSRSIYPLIYIVTSLNRHIFLDFLNRGDKNYAYNFVIESVYDKINIFIYSD